jgi:uncharacterized protein YkwD
MPGRLSHLRKRSPFALVLLALAAVAPAGSANSASTSAVAVPRAQVVGSARTTSTKGAVDDSGRLVQCMSTAAGKIWVWSAAVPADLTAAPLPASWSAVAPVGTGSDAEAPVPALPGQYANRAAMEARLVELTNQMRTERGLRPLVVDPRLTRLARSWAEQTGEPAFAGRGTAHCPPTLCAVRAAEIGYPSFGEVIRPWNPFPKGDMADERFFIDSPRHVAILTNDRVTHIGFGVHIIGDPSAPESVVVVGQVGRSR